MLYIIICMNSTFRFQIKKKLQKVFKILSSLLGQCLDIPKECRVPYSLNGKWKNFCSFH